MDTRTKEAVRYLGYGTHAVDDNTLILIADSFRELEESADKRIICRIFDVSHEKENRLTIGKLHIESRSLSKNMTGCKKAVLLGATLGSGVDVLMRRYSLTNMAKAVVLQACAAAMLEEYLDDWQALLAGELKEEGRYLRPRFSPGYGDFSILHQEMVLKMLDAPKTIGLSMTESFMLTPVKSVTAVIGISETEEPCHRKGCEACGKADCIYRRDER